MLDCISCWVVLHRAVVAVGVDPVGEPGVEGQVGGADLRPLADLHRLLV